MKNLKDSEQTMERQVPPYLPYSRFLNFVQGLRQAGLPGRIDRSLMSRFSGGEQSALITALRFLGLVSADGKPLKLAALYKAEGDEWKHQLQEVLTSSYTFLFAADGFDIKNATREQLEAQFRSAGVSGDTVRKCVSFFLEAAKDADLEVSPWFGTPRTRSARGSVARRSRGPEKPGSPLPSKREEAPAPEITPVQMLYEILDTETMDEDEQQAVWTLLRYLKRTESQE